MGDPESVAWYLLLSGFLLGSFAVLIPGFPGAAIALIGLAAYAALHDFAVVSESALVVAALVVAGSAVLQVLAPAVSSRAWGGTGAAASGAAAGAAIGCLVPVPGVPLLTAVVGAVLFGLLGVWRAPGRSLWGVAGAGAGCLVAIGVDALALLGVVSVFAVSDFLAHWPP